MNLSEMPTIPTTPTTPTTPPTAGLEQLAGELRVGLGLLVRRLRHATPAGDLTLPESSALARLDRGGPATSAELARQEQISPQSMGATLAALEARGLLSRTPDPSDGRRVLLSVSDAGAAVLWSRRDARTQRLASGLGAAFTDPELAQLAAAVPLLERLAAVI
jgi:DNA-binding MarR family transcriptional regulator